MPVKAISAVTQSTHNDFTCRGRNDRGDFNRPRFASAFCDNPSHYGLDLINRYVVESTGDYTERHRNLLLKVIS